MKVQLLGSGKAERYTNVDMILKELRLVYGGRIQ